MNVFKGNYICYQYPLSKIVQHEHLEEELIPTVFTAESCMNQSSVDYDYTLNQY